MLFLLSRFKRSNSRHLQSEIQPCEIGSEQDGAGNERTCPEHGDE